MIDPVSLLLYTLSVAIIVVLAVGVVLFALLAPAIVTALVAKLYDWSVFR